MAQRAHSSNMTSSEEAKECPICKEPGMDVGLRECLHTFHRDCILDWIQRKKENSDCPICRQHIDEEMVVEFDELMRSFHAERKARKDAEKELMKLQQKINALGVGTGTVSAGIAPPSGSLLKPIRVLHHSVPHQRAPIVSYMERGQMTLDFPDHVTHGAIVKQGQFWEKQDDGNLMLREGKRIFYHGSHRKESKSRTAKKQSKRDANAQELENLRQEAIQKGIQVDESEMVVPTVGISRCATNPELINRYLRAFGRQERIIGPATQVPTNPYVRMKRGLHPLSGQGTSGGRSRRDEEPDMEH